MNIDQLKYFADLAKTNSITTTAKRMFISQQALSESLKRLENELGCTLVTRSKSGVEFTEDGRMVLEYSLKILEQHKVMEEQLQIKYNKSQLQGKLVVGVGSTVSDAFLPHLMLKMYRHYPGIKLHVLEHTRDTLFSLLKDSEMNFAIFGVYKPEGNDENKVAIYDRLTEPVFSSKLYMEELYRDDIVCVMSKNHPLAANKVLTGQQLRDIPQTSYGTNIHSITEGNSLHVSTNAKIHQQFMLEENVVCSMPYQAYLAKFNDKNFVFRPISDYPPIVYYLMYRKDMLEENEILYTRFIETAVSLAKNL